MIQERTDEVGYVTREQTSGGDEREYVEVVLIYIL